MPHTQQELPFVMEGNVASRETVRQMSKTVDGLRKIDISLIRIRPGFNARRQNGLPEYLWEQTLGIPELAEAIYANNGPADPVIGDIHKDGYFYITEGERRIRAIRHLIKSGREYYPNNSAQKLNFVHEVTVILNPAGTTDIERKKKILSTNNKLRLKPMERAFFFLSFKTEYSLTNQQIADELGISRQQVDNYIIAATELPKEVQDKIDADELKITLAISEHRRTKPGSRKSAQVDLESGEILTEYQEAQQKEREKEADKVRGDEDEFKQEDNSKTFSGSMNLPEDKGSGAHVVGTDSIHKQQQDIAAWKQLLNRITVITANLCGKNMAPEEFEKALVDRLRNEYKAPIAK